jgi:hypothetical protein
MCTVQPASKKYVDYQRLFCVILMVLRTISVIEIYRIDVIVLIIHGKRPEKNCHYINQSLMARVLGELALSHLVIKK